MRTFERADGRLIQLLGPVDAAELGLLDAEDEEEEGSDEEEEEGSEEESVEEAVAENEDVELKPYEDLDEEDPDVAPVEKNTVNDKVRSRLPLLSFRRPAHSRFSRRSPSSEYLRRSRRTPASSTPSLSSTRLL